MAVLDTKVDIAHPRLLLRTVGGLNVVTNSILTTLTLKGSATGHGTFVSAIVLRTAPRKVMPIAVLDENGRGSTAQVAAGIRYAVNRGADVINMSLHTTVDTQVLREAIQYEQSKNVIVVAAGGNEGRQSPDNIYPAKYPGVIAVMSVDGKDQRAAFSNYGRAVSWLPRASM